MHQFISSEACKIFEGYINDTSSAQIHCNEVAKIQNFAENISRQGGCFQKIKDKGPLTFHSWISGGEKWKDSNFRLTVNLILQAFMITQDLSRSSFIFWVPPEDINLVNKFNGDIFKQYHPYVSLQAFDYDFEVSRTPLVVSDILSNYTNLKSVRFKGYKENNYGFSLYSDIVRSVLLFNYGGVWLDNDAIPLTNLYHITIGVGYQFAPRHSSGFFNNHVMFSYKGSKLARRKLETLLSLPIEHADAWPELVRSTMLSQDGWIFNSGASAQLHAVQERLYDNSRRVGLRDYLEDFEFSYPLSWFDPEWECGYMGNGDSHTSDIPCRRFFVWHRLSKHYVASLTDWNSSDCNNFCRGVKSVTKQIVELSKKFTIQPMELDMTKCKATKSVS